MEIAWCVLSTKFELLFFESYYLCRAKADSVRFPVVTATWWRFINFAAINLTLHCSAFWRGLAAPWRMVLMASRMRLRLPLFEAKTKKPPDSISFRSCSMPSHGLYWVEGIHITRNQKRSIGVFWRTTVLKARIRKAACTGRSDLEKHAMSQYRRRILSKYTATRGFYGHNSAAAES